MGEARMSRRPIRHAKRPRSRFEEHAILASMDVLRAIAEADNLIFDYDGVLADSEEFQLDVWRQLFAERLLPTDHLSIASIAGVSDRLAVENSCPGLPAPLYDDLVKEKKRRCAEQAGRVEPVAGMRELLATLHPEKALFICSSSPRSTISSFVDRQFPGVAFQAVIGKGDYERPKPHAAPYLKLLEQTGISADRSLAIEDSLAGLQSARAAGLPVIHFDRYGSSAGDTWSVGAASSLTRWREKAR